MVDGVKKIPYNIHDLLSPRALAFWAMVDGSLSESGFYLNTLSYSRLCRYKNILFYKRLYKTNFI